MTYDELLDLGERLRERRLKTATGKAFTVSQYMDSLVFTPESTGRGQSDGRKATERFLVRYNEIGSLRPSDYAHLSRNASYLVGLLLEAGEAEGPEEHV